jgi:flagellar biosynthetic protein FlhB
MADESQSQERTEAPTPKRLEDARRKGDVPRSRELTMATVMLSGAAALLVLAGSSGERLLEGFRAGFSLERAAAFDTSRMADALAEGILNGLLAFAPLALVLVAAAVGGSALVGGFAFSLQAAGFKAARLNPVNGLKRLFSLHGLNELLKALAKFALVAAFAAFCLWRSTDELLALGFKAVEPAIGAAARLTGTSLLVVCSSLLLIAAVDVPFQIVRHRKRLRMTRTEVREELKETEGRPEVKSRLRTLQQQAATRRMMDAVPTADVVVVNPTRFAVALRYVDSEMRAPRVVAKGRGHVAARIREIAQQHGVPLLTAPPLARALYRSTPVGQEIPAALYAAVAQVLAWVYELKNPRAAGRQPAPPNPEIDERLFPGAER